METGISREHFADLVISGISTTTATEAGLHSLGAQEMAERLGFPIPAETTGLAFPYEDGFIRVKLFPPLTGNNGTMRYGQPTGSGVKLYVPHTVRSILTNSTIPLYITEGEKKALKACQEGLPCLGIGGLWNWIQDGQPIDDLDLCAWVERRVVLVPDSDVWSRQDLLRPVYALGKELENRGAGVSVTIIPQEDGKLGLDDFLVAQGRSAFDALTAIKLKHNCFTEAKLWHKGWIKKRATEPEEKVRYSARFPGLVDLVKEDAEVCFLVAADAVEAVDKWPAEDGSLMLPPPPEAAPYEILPAKLVIEHLKDDDTDLYHSIVEILRTTSELPSEEHYHLGATHTFFTHKAEAAPYFPYLWFFGLPERGKSRIAKVLTKLGWRGLYTETLNQAYIFRFADLFGGTLGLDVYELVKRAQKKGSHDLLLGRFEQGVKVARVIAPDKGPFKDTLYFAVSGPTIIATNEEVPTEDPLRSRCIKISMPEARGIYPNIRDEDLRELRARLLAWRARHLGTPLPDVDKPVAGRLGDLMQPLFSIAELLPPEARESLETLTRGLEEERQDAESETMAGRVVEALFSLRNDIIEGRLSVERIRDVVNDGIEKEWHVSPQRIGRELSSLAINRKKSQGKMHATLTPTGLEKLFKRFGWCETSPTSPSSLSPVVKPKNGGEINSETSPASTQEEQPEGDGGDSENKPPSRKPALSEGKGDRGDKGDNAPKEKKIIIPSVEHCSTEEDGNPCTYFDMKDHHCYYDFDSPVAVSELGHCPDEVTIPGRAKQ